MQTIQDIPSKLPNTGTTIFTKMSTLANEHKAINLSQGFPEFHPEERLIALVAEHMKAGHNQYTHMFGLPALRKTLAQTISNNYGVNIDHNTEINVTAGATQAIFTAIQAVIMPGDEAIILQPAYDCYAPSVKVAGGIVRYLNLRPEDFSVDWEAVEAAITLKTRLLIINNPHNPAGTILDEADMERLKDIIQRNDLFLLSDEVYEHLVYDEQEHLSALRYPELRERAFVISSFGKTFHCTGWKMGYVVAPDVLMKEFRKVHQYNVFSVNTPIQHALSDFMNENPNYIDSLRPQFQTKRDHFLTALKDSRLRVLPCKGSYFLLVDYSVISQEKDVDVAVDWTTKHKVASVPVSVFYEGGKGPNYLRFCFAKNEDTLLSAAEILSKL